MSDLVFMDLSSTKLIGVELVINLPSVRFLFLSWIRFTKLTCITVASKAAGGSYQYFLCLSISRIPAVLHHEHRCLRAKPGHSVHLAGCAGGSVTGGVCVVVRVELSLDFALALPQYGEHLPDGPANLGR